MRRFGLIGKTLKHSFSQKFFEQKFAAENITDCVYENFELPSIEEFKTLINTIPDLNGLNITIPYKTDVVQFLDEKGPEVESIGACNCIHIKEEKLFGYNTDAPAFKKSLETKLKPYHRCALILGTGGASKAVQHALHELNIDFLLVSRHKETNQLGYEDLGEDTVKNHHIIINTTPLGMHPNVNADPPFPYRYLTPEHLLFDLIYNPEKTKFLQEGEKMGAQIVNGYEMLVLQAEESWKIWNEMRQ